jgi:hypothetical protein
MRATFCNNRSIPHPMGDGKVRDWRRSSLSATADVYRIFISLEFDGVSGGVTALPTRNEAMKKLIVVVFLVFAQAPAFAADPICPKPAAASSAAASAAEEAPGKDAPAEDAPENTLLVAALPDAALTGAEASNAAPSPNETQSAAPAGDISFSAPEFSRAGTDWSEKTAWAAKDAALAKSFESGQFGSKSWTDTADGFQENYQLPEVRAFLLKREALREMAENKANGTTNKQARDAYCAFVSQNTATN